jgi:hypothetical protein
LTNSRPKEKTEKAKNSRKRPQYPQGFVALLQFDEKKMLLQPFDHNYQSVQVKQDYEIVNKVLNIEKQFM